MFGTVYGQKITGQKAIKLVFQ